jgi:hypothetical protein
MSASEIKKKWTCRICKDFVQTGSCSRDILELPGPKRCAKGFHKNPDGALKLKADYKIKIADALAKLAAG